MKCLGFPCVLSRVQLFAAPWTVAHQVPLSVRFSRQEYWSGLPCPYSGDLFFPGKGSNLNLLHLLLCRQVFFFFFPLTTEPPGKSLSVWPYVIKAAGTQVLWGTPGLWHLNTHILILFDHFILPSCPFLMKPGSVKQTKAILFSSTSSKTFKPGVPTSGI